MCVQLAVVKGMVRGEEKNSGMDEFRFDEKNGASSQFSGEYGALEGGSEFVLDREKRTRVWQVKISFFRCGGIDGSTG